VQEVSISTGHWSRDPVLWVRLDLS